MSVARQSPDPARVEARDALVDAKRRAGGGPGRVITGPHTLMALQRSAGNAAVSALMAGRLRSPGGQAVTDIDAALREIRRDEPAIDTVEKGLRAAKAAGVPVDLEGPKPPASALAVTKTGFGPGSVAEKKPVSAAKPIPAVSPLGKVAAKAPHPPPGPGGQATAVAPTGGGAAAVLGPAPMTADKLLQPPVPPTGRRPEEDPAFTHVRSGVVGFAKAKKAHPPAASKAKEAQDAALPPTDDLAGQAKAAKVDTMDAQPVGAFDKKAFIAAVKAAIEAKSPKTLKEADNYRESGKAGEVKGEVKGLVTAGKQGEAKDVETATAAPPDQSKAVPKPVTPMAAEQPGQSVTIPAAGAAPKPAPAEQTNLAAGKAQANQEMADAEVTESQLAQSNEPQFQSALADKQAAAAHADTAPAEFRQQEQQVIAQSKTDATAETAAGVTGMQGAKGAALAKLVADKGATKSKDEAKRAEVSTKIQGIFAATEADVKKILDGIDPKVEAAFEQGEATARSAFEAYVAGKMSAYKKDRYGGWLGGLRWAKDKLLGMPDKVNEFYEAGRELYLKQMDGVISRVADIVAGDLTAAKQRIAKGKADIASYVKSLPADLRKVGSEASKEIGEKFEQLENDVNAKQDAVVDTLATKYVEARKGLDERIEALQAENKGLVDKAIGAIKAVINTIRELAAMLKNVLSRVAGVVGDIIKHPVAFLGNLIAGIKGGILKFKDNILDHLRKGLMSWLFGALAEGGIELPGTFDIKGIIKLLASIFGLTWANIRNRLVKQIGEKAMAAAEKGVEIFKVIATEGVAGLWNMLLEKLGDIKEMILEQVKDFVITKIITAGITWLIGLLNPAAAFIKACKLIYDVIMFFVDNAARILKFVNTVIDSVADIVKGNVGSVVDKINDVLGQMVPIIIGFLASVIGIGGIGQKIRQIIQTLQKPINKAIDFVIKTGLKLAGPIIRGIKGISGKVKAKVAAGKAWVKGKVLGGDDSPEGKQKRLNSGMAAGLAVMKRFSGKPVGERVLKPLLGAIKLRYGMTALIAEKKGERWGLHGMVNPDRHDTSDALVEEISDKILLESVTVMRGRTDGLLKEAEKASKRMASAVKSAKPKASQATITKAKAAEPGLVVETVLKALRKSWSDEEARFSGLGTKPKREILIALRAVYVDIEKRVAGVMTDLGPADTHLAGLNSARDSVKRSWGEIGKERRKGLIAAALKAKENHDVATEIEELGKLFDAAEKKRDGLDLAKPVDIETLRGQYEQMKEPAATLLLTVSGLSDPQSLEKERQDVLARAESAIKAARASEQALPTGTDPTTGAVGAMIAERTALESAVAGIRAAAAGRGVLRDTLIAANNLIKTTGRVSDQSDLGRRIRKQRAVIDGVIGETTRQGRPGATEGEGERKGTTEAGIDVEVATARQFRSDEGHYLKIAEKMNVLVAAAVELIAMEPGAGPADRASIADALAAAQKRYLGLKTGLDAWNARASHPERWHSGGTSKIIPSWPTWKTPDVKPWPR